MGQAIVSAMPMRDGEGEAPISNLLLYNLIHRKDGQDDARTREQIRIDKVASLLADLF
ncbi:hypothetical protein [Rhizobium sp. P32RR-XVIII]|uniref:hypothetical protein n=1 Tax=Rhizobium sp. P32RR-XVIII TaxID=2726738 RepID=UPI00197DBD65|nr:hypothetical protein [Rhizobium sp. P32RR-XVIII]